MNGVSVPCLVVGQSLDGPGRRGDDRRPRRREDVDRIVPTGTARSRARISVKQLLGLHSCDRDHQPGRSDHYFLGHRSRGPLLRVRDREAPETNRQNCRRGREPDEG